MLLITKNTTNNVILTLAEKTTLENVVYLFEVISDVSNVSKCFIAQDISGNKIRFNEFDLIENATEDLLIGKFTLSSGFYKYKVYEQASTTNLDPLLALNLVEIGKLKVASTLTALPVYTGNPINTVSYGG